MSRLSLWLSLGACCSRGRSLIARRCTGSVLESDSPFPGHRRFPTRFPSAIRAMDDSACRTRVNISISLSRNSAGKLDARSVGAPHRQNEHLLNRWRPWGCTGCSSWLLERPAPPAERQHFHADFKRSDREKLILGGAGGRLEETGPNPTQDAHVRPLQSGSLPTGPCV